MRGAATAEDLSALCEHVCGVFEDWIYTLFREKDALALYYLAEAHFAVGDKAKAQETGKKALAAAENESAGLKNFITTQVKKFDE